MRPIQQRIKKSRQGGFTLVELAIATVVVLVGAVALAQLVPVALYMNQANRNDSSALVYAQRELEQMIHQPLAATAFTDADGNPCSLGDPTSPNVVVGSPVATLNNATVIDFTAAEEPGYSFNYHDPNDPMGSFYDVRWAVITTVKGSTVTGKRFVLGALKRSEKTPFQPVTLDVWVQR